MNNIILSIDPGDTTGYALAEVSKEQIKILDFGLATYPIGVRRLHELAKGVDVVVIEDFIIRKPLIGERPSALRIIGSFEIAFPSRPQIVLQQPFEKGRCPDKLLQKLSLWEGSPHIRDAFRHCVIYAQKKFKFRG